MKHEAGFALFLVVWNRMQGQGTPKVHLRIARWLEARWEAKDVRLLLMAFRSCGKSTIVGLFAAWLLWRRPALRILVLAADAALATKMVRQCRRIIERHPLCKSMIPARPEEWAADRFTINREAQWRDPSMMAAGVGVNITGSRADMIICDDVEVPNTCDTAEKRENLRERLAELSFVLVPGGTQLYVGTPHSYESIYDKKFLHGYKALKVPLIKANGLSAWPERFSLEDIERLKTAGGPRRFAAQMMLKAISLESSRLNVDLLRRYEGELVYSEVQGRVSLHIEGVRMASVSAWWDPAFGNGGDGSVVAIVFADTNGGYWLHRVVYLKNDPLAQEDEATQQCRAVAALCRAYYVPSISVEINGIGRFLPAILRREMKGAAGVVEISNRRPKALRIMEAFDAPLAARALHVHGCVFETNFLREMREWKPGGGGHDDGLDAVAGALGQSPVRVGSYGHSLASKTRWQGGGSYEGKTDFNVME